ncbi:hypothetical protein MOQ95_005503 [Salmonella enterica]|nr:hypothetical protein [Salmonella enterica]
MAILHEQLAESLEALKQVEEKQTVAIRSNELSRTYRERLIKFGFLQEVMKGGHSSLTRTINVSLRRRQNGSASTNYPSTKGKYKLADLLYGTSIFDMRTAMPSEQNIVKIDLLGVSAS